MVDPQGVPSSLDVTIRCTDGKTQHGRADVASMDLTTRLRRASRSLALAWSAAFITAFIPILHFVLVPGFFGFGIYLFWKVFKRSLTITGGKALCPACDAPLEVSPEILVSPQRDYCPSCRWSYIMSLTPPGTTDA